MRIYACLFPNAFFLRLTKNKIRTRYAYFSSIYKEIFLKCDVTRLISIVVMVLAFETFNLGSVLTKFYTFLHIRNRLFLQLFLGSFVSIFLQSF